MEDFKAEQLDLLMSIKKGFGLHNSNSDKIVPYSELIRSCKWFLDNQRNQLKFLEERRKVHMLEKGKVLFRLVDHEQVALPYLKEIFTVSAKPLDDFIQFITRLAKNNNSTLEALRQQALEIATDMLKISVVLETQPGNTNYDKNKNPVPNLLCLGAQCFSGFSFDLKDCHLAGVLESDLHKAFVNHKPLELVNGFKGFIVKEEVQKQTKASKAASANQSHDAVTISLGSWSIPKDQLAASEKGNAHKDWIRLKYNIRVKLYDTVLNLWLLSLPFNIRKGSIQMYTFRGAFMWYYYNTTDPYKDFTIPPRLPTSTVLDMLVKRMEVIGRKLSKDAREFFAKRLENLSSNGKVELEMVTKGPPSTRSHQQSESNPSVDNTPTVDDAISTYGFFTWFYALALSLDKSGYLNELWLKGYIYDICEFEFAEKLVKDPLFGLQTVVLRPSVSKIESYQGKDINMGIAFSFKTVDHPVVSIKLLMGDVKSNGLVKCLTTKMPNKYIWMMDNHAESIEKMALPSLTAGSEVFQYHHHRYMMGGGPELLDSDGGPLICNCQCHNDVLNSQPDGQSQLKKSRNFSGDSDGSSLTFDEGLFHKRRQLPNGCRPVTSGNTVPSSQYSNSSDNQPGGSPDSGTWGHMVPYENLMPDFDSILLSFKDSHADKEHPMTALSSPSNRELLIDNFLKAAKIVSSACADDMIELLTNKLMDIGMANQSQSSPFPPGQMTMAENTNKDNNKQNINAVDTFDQWFTGGNTGETPLLVSGFEVDGESDNCIPFSEFELQPSQQHINSDQNSFAFW